jgi:probable selenium-dependent hydroxylase accessory protein YqeC
LNAVLIVNAGKASKHKTLCCPRQTIEFFIVSGNNMTELRNALMLGDGGVVSLVGAGGKTSLMFRLARELSRAGDSVLTTTTTKIRFPTPEQSNRVIVSASTERVIREAGRILETDRHVTAAADRIPDQRKLTGFAPELIQVIWQSGLFRWIVVEADGAAGRPLKYPAPHEPVVAGCTTHAVAVAGLAAVGRPLTEQWVFRPREYGQATGLAPGDLVTEASVAKAITHASGLFKGSPVQARRFVFLNLVHVRDGAAVGYRVVAALKGMKASGLERVVLGMPLERKAVLTSYNLAEDD